MSDNLPHISIPDVPVSELSAKEVHALVTNSISLAISSAVLDIISSPQVATFMESAAKGKALSGMLEALVSHDGRKGLDAQTMKQNSLEIAHFIEQAFNKFKERARDVENGVDPELKSAEELAGFAKPQS